jgi:hypothetical protein
MRRSQAAAVARRNAASGVAVVRRRAVVAMARNLRGFSGGV